MPKLALNNIASGYATNSTLNANFDTIETAMENTLSRDGSTPNHMLSSLDMNSHSIHNLGRATTLSSAMSLGQFLEYANTEESLTGVVPITWDFTSTGDSSYTLPLASTNKVDMYIISSNGIVISPTQYSVLVDEQRITFNTPPAIGEAIVVRLFGKIPEATASSITINNIRQSYIFDIATNETTFTTTTELEENTDVFLNGVKLVFSQDYTIDGYSVELSSPGSPGDIVEVITHSAIVVASDILQDVIDATADVEELIATLDEAIDDSLSAVTAEATTLVAGSDATASFNTTSKALTLGIPVGATGATGATGSTGATGAGVVVGGTAGQLLTKVDGTNYNTTWGNTITSPSVVGDITLSGDGHTITGNLTGDPAQSLSFKHDTDSEETQIFVVGPGATVPAAYISCWGKASDTPTLTMGLDATTASISTSKAGTSSYLPLTFSVGGVERLRIDTSGNTLVKSAAVLGYGTGAGGTVTQNTSKSTLVTLNKPCGQIIMHNEALAANTPVQFAFYNNLLTATDVILWSLGGGVGATASYNVHSLCSSGLAYTVLKNVSGGSLSEAVVLNFVVIRGVTS